MAQFADPLEPEYFLDAFPRDDFPRYVWDDRPTGLPPRFGRNSVRCPPRPSTTCSRHV